MQRKKKQSRSLIKPFILLYRLNALNKYLLNLAGLWLRGDGGDVDHFEILPERNLNLSNTSKHITVVFQIIAKKWGCCSKSACETNGTGEVIRMIR